MTRERKRFLSIVLYTLFTFKVLFINEFLLTEEVKAASRETGNTSSITTSHITMDESSDETDKTSSETSSETLDAGDFFPDVTQDKWFYTNVKTLVDKGIINGYPDGTFKPYEPVYADAFIKMVVMAMGNRVRENNSGYWADPYIEKAKTLALIFDGEFDTFQRPITREEMAMIIVRASSEGFLDNFRDYKKLILDIDYSNMYLTDYILKAYSTGILTGLPDGTFKPKNNAQRAEAAAIIHRMIDPIQRKIPSLVMETTVRAEADKEFEDFINSEEGAEYASNYYFRAENGAIIFRNNGLGEVLPNNSHFEDINRITYNVIKELVKYARRDNHYVRAFYSPATFRVGIHYYPNRVQGEKARYPGMFYVALDPLPRKWYDEQTQDTYVFWDTSGLWDDSHIDKFLADNEFMAMEYYEPLQEIFNIVYGEEDGPKLFEYAINEYLQERRQGMERINRSILYVNGYEIVNSNGEAFEIRFNTNIK
ncbi:MAG TPA: S-layer homology domain-containing protein [Clostridiaceae bacterium]|nr:S-layer homology domain-containing protein [Clostridiaceae bacterium]